MKNFLNFTLLILAVATIAFFSMPPKARAIVENQIVGFWGVTPVQSQPPATTDLLTVLKNYGLIGTGTSSTPLNLNGGALQVGTITVGGTSYGGTIANTYFVNPNLSGTITIASPVYSGTGSGTLQGVDLVAVSGSGTATVAGTLRLSGTNLLIWSGSSWITK